MPDREERRLYGIIMEAAVVELRAKYTEGEEDAGESREVRAGWRCVCRCVCVSVGVWYRRLSCVYWCNTILRTDDVCTYLECIVSYSKQACVAGVKE